MYIIVTLSGNYIHIYYTLLNLAEVLDLLNIEFSGCAV